MSYLDDPLQRTMTEKLGADCVCGFTFTTPHGADDALAVLELHIQRVHPDMKTTKEQLVKTIAKR
jgi:hypothetical protein